MEKKTSRKSAMAEAKVRQKNMEDASALKLQHCRVCDKLLLYSEFAEATNPAIDKNGKMSVCKKCAEKLVKERLNVFQNDYSKTFYSVCKDLDIRYDDGIVSQSVARLESSTNKKGCSCFTSYTLALKLKYPDNTEWRFSDSTFESAFKNQQDSKSLHNKKEMLLKWGEFSDADYTFLETTFEDYVKAYGAVTPSEKDTFKTLALLLLRQRTDPANKDITAALKNQYELIGINPKALRQENKDKGKMIIGMEAELIEMTRPAEVYDDPSLYFDHDGLNRDILDIKRAIKNHLTGSRDFQSEGVDISEVFVDSDDDDEVSE